MMKKSKNILLLFILLIGSSCNEDNQIVQPALPSQPPEQIDTWDLVGLASVNDIYSILVTPTKPWIIYVGVISDFSDGTYGKILKSADWGETWTTLIGDISVTNIIIDPNNVDILYAGLNPNNYCTPGVIKSTNSGNTWVRIDSMMGLTWEDFPRITIDPINSNILYTSIAGPNRGGLLKLKDTGLTWSVLPPKASGVVGFAIDPKNPNELYLSMNWSGYLLKSYDGGETFITVLDKGGDLPRIIVVNPFRTNVVYTGYIFGGFQKSVDHGMSWQVGVDSVLPFIGSIDDIAL